MPDNSAAPNDTRYIPFTQQAECCVPTSILMIMYRNNVPLISAEELGYHLGLVIPTEEKHLFYKPRVSKLPPSSGYGTQIYKDEYEPNKVFRKLGIPFHFRMILADKIKDEADLLSLLRDVEEQDYDALLCFNHGVIRGEFKPYSGHVAVFDRIIDNQIRLVDASPNHPKWRLVRPGLMLDAVKRHGNKNSGGIWLFVKDENILQTV